MTNEETTGGENVIHVNPDQFKDILWPAKTDINVYVTGAKAKTTKAGEQRLVLSFIASDDQPTVELKAHAGESFEVWFGTTGRPQEKKLYRALLFAAFGGLSSYDPETLNGLPFTIQVTHGKPQEDGSQRMFLESLRAG
jgi:hypothetical protein